MSRPTTSHHPEGCSFAADDHGVQQAYEVRVQFLHMTGYVEWLLLLFLWGRGSVPMCGRQRASWDVIPQASSTLPCPPKRASHCSETCQVG